MSEKVFIKGKGEITLTQHDHIATGGQGSVYHKGKRAFKIYTKPKEVIPVEKIKELHSIKEKNVLIPKEILLSPKTKKPIGYTMQYLKNTEALCKLFTKGFRKNNSIKPEDIKAVVTKIQETVVEIHAAKCLVVDMNEMNFLIDSKFKTPYFIDTDSFQTPSFPATYIMSSIRDRLAKKFTELSDWFSFAVISFQLYIGIHPYKGKHPKFKPSEWEKRMDAGISVFDKAVKLPSTCQDMSVIPKAHFKWFESIFVGKDRSIPPPADAIITAAPVSNVIQSTADFKIEVLKDYKDAIRHIDYFDGTRYVVTTKQVVWGNKVVSIEEGSKVFLLSADGGGARDAWLSDGKLMVRTDGFTPVETEKVMPANGALYYIQNQSLLEIKTMRVGKTLTAVINKRANVMESSSQLFSGIVFQDLLGTCWVTVPYELGSCLYQAIPELNGHRIISAKYQSGVCYCMVESKGKYDRVRIRFDFEHSTYDFKSEQDITLDSINFVVLTNGVCVRVVGDDFIEVSRNGQSRMLINPPIDSSMPLFNDGQQVLFVDGSKLCSITTS